MNGYIFRCSGNTYKPCIDMKLFGASESAGSTISKIKKGDILYLYNKTRKLLFGPFIADSDGTKNIIPEAWEGEYPWQVKVKDINVGFPIRRQLFEGMISFFRDLPHYVVSEEKMLRLNQLLEKATKPKDSELDFRTKDPRNILTKDGHMTQSHAEAKIDDWLYEHGIVHMSEPSLSDLVNWHADFLIPLTAEPFSIYIEYWGMDHTEYLENKKRKLKYYQKYGYTLIELERGDERKLDSVLKKKLEPYFLLMVKPKLD